MHLYPLAHSRGKVTKLLLSLRIFYFLSPSCHQQSHGVTLMSTSSWVHKLMWFAHLLESGWWKDEGEGSTHCSSGGHGKIRVLLSLNTTPQLRAEIIVEHSFLTSVISTAWGNIAQEMQWKALSCFLHDRASVGICRWHGRLCLPTVVSGSIHLTLELFWIEMKVVA